MPTATPPDQVQAVLAEAVVRPTLGARQLVDHLVDRGVRLSPSGVQKLLVRHRLGRRAQRVAALTQLTAATTGVVTTAAKHGPFGFCHFAAPLAQPQRGLRTLPRDRAPGVLPAGLPPPALRSPGRPGRPVQGWLKHYNTRRRNHGDFMRGRMPLAVMQGHLS